MDGDQRSVTQCILLIQSYIPMKRFIITIGIIALTASAGLAQHLGIKGGLTFSNLNIDEVTDENLRFGYHFGAYLNLPLGERFAFQPEVNYTTKGATAEYDVLFFNGEYSFNLSYIDVPLMGVLRLSEGFEIHAGPYLGILTQASLSTDGDLGEGQEPLDKDHFQSLDYGLAAGIALNFEALQIGARYHYGLREIAQTEDAELFMGDASHSYFQIYAALRLGTY